MTRLKNGFHSRFSEIEENAIAWVPLGGKTGLASHKGRLCTAKPLQSLGLPQGEAGSDCEAGRRLKRVFLNDTLPRLPPFHVGHGPSTLSGTSPPGRAMSRAAVAGRRLKSVVSVARNFPKHDLHNRTFVLYYMHKSILRTLTKGVFTLKQPSGTIKKQCK